MDFRTTKDGLLVAAFKLLGGEPIKTGYLEKVGSYVPQEGMKFADASITIDGTPCHVIDLEIHASKIVIWKFPNANALQVHDMSLAIMVNGVYQWLDLRLQIESVSQDPKYIGYFNPENQSWIDFVAAGKVLR